MERLILSYVLTTYNKFEYLTHVLERLITACQPDEEIIVIDGGSKDATVQYLTGLHEAGKIQQFISEPDKGESHGFNKGMLLAKGEVIKIITDDDAFCFPVIRMAAEFMVENPEVDVLLGRSAATHLDNLAFAIIPTKPADDYQLWFQNGTPFWMVGLTTMIRRNSLALTGMFSTEVALPDLEFTYRITSMKANIAWCTGILSMHVSNENGNYNRMSLEARKAEYERVHQFYTKHAPAPVPTYRQLASEVLKRPLRPFKQALINALARKPMAPSSLEPEEGPEPLSTGYVPRLAEDNLEAAYRVCDEFMRLHNAAGEINFMYKKVELKKVFVH